MFFEAYSLIRKLFSRLGLACEEIFVGIYVVFYSNCAQRVYHPEIQLQMSQTDLASPLKSRGGGKSARGLSVEACTCVRERWAVLAAFTNDDVT
jgi:hypothetical protein